MEDRSVLSYKRSTQAYTKTWKELDGYKFSLFGSGFVIASETLVFPAEVLKTRLQCNNSSFTRLFPMIQNVLKTEGVQGLFRGYASASLGMFPGQAIYFASYEYMLHCFSEWTSKSAWTGNNVAVSLLNQAGAGFCAEMLAGSTYVPSEIISQRIQAGIGPSLRFKDHVRSMWHKEGIRGFYRGYFAYALVYAPQSAVSWVAYEACEKCMVHPYTSKESVGGKYLVHTVSGLAAGVISTITSQPLDFAKTRYQVLAAVTHGFWKYLRECCKAEGWKAMMTRGLAPRLFYTVPVTTLTLLGYEFVKDSSCM